MGLLGRVYLLVALAVVPAFALVAIIHFQELQQREAAAEAEALRSARLVAGEFEQILQSVARVLSAAAAAPAVTSLDEPGCTTYLRRVQEVIPSAGVTAVAGPDGALHCSAVTGISIADRPYFEEVLRSDDLVVGGYTIGRGTGDPVLPLAMRLETAEGPAVIVTGLNLDWVADRFTRRYSEFPPHSSLTIIDRDGTILVRLPNRDREGNQVSLYPFLVESETGGTFRSIAEETADGVARFVGFTSPNEAPALGFSVAVGLPQAPMLAELREKALRNFLLLGLIALLSLAAAAFGGRLFIHKPAAHLLAVIGGWRGRNMSTRATTSGLPRPFAQIGRAFNELAAELEAALQHKDLLLRELNHRMTNSFTTVSSLLRMQSQTISDNESRELFDNAIRRIESLALVYKRMQAVEGVESLDFSAFLHDLCRDLHDSMMESATPCIVEADNLQLSPAQVTPLTLIVNELVTNALKHGAQQGGPVRVFLLRSKDSCRLAVHNPGALPADYEPGRTQGFGMKMVTAMVRHIEGELEATTTTGETQFTVTFKPSEPQPTLPESSDPTFARSGSVAG